jgi:hypothetical protein
MRVHADVANRSRTRINQIYYSSSTDGQHWSVPVSVISTDYTFSASVAQANNPSQSLGISAYYSGRAYGPSVWQNADGSLTMTFAGYRLPKPIPKAGTLLGTGGTQYKIGTTDPALYRNILTVALITTQRRGDTRGPAGSPAAPRHRGDGRCLRLHPTPQASRRLTTEPTPLHRCLFADAMA